MREIYFNGPTYLMETPYEVNTGMGIFSNEYLETGELPSHGLLFHLAGNYNTLTMEGVPFPIHVTYYDREMNVIGYEYAYPGMPNTPMPPGVWWMYEHV